MNSVDGVIGGLRQGLFYSYMIYHMNFIIVFCRRVCLHMCRHICVQKRSINVFMYMFSYTQLRSIGYPLRAGMQSFINCSYEREQECTGFLLKVP